MTNILETAAWAAGIRQIELTDAVLGGAPNEALGAGIVNIAPQQLANRTKWLRDYMQSAGLGMASTVPVEDLDALSGGGFFTATASAVGSPDGTAAVAVINVPATASTGGFQVAFRQGSTTKLWVRRKTGGEWSGWLELLHSGNMGTAAQATLQTSPTDGNAGRVLLVGGFGLGGDAPRITNLNTLQRTGFYEILDDAVGAPPQSPSTWVNGSLIHITGAAGQRTQFASLNGDGSQGFLQMRIDDGTGAGWSNWLVFYNSNSIIPVANGGTGASTAAGARAALIATSTLGSVGTHAFLRRSTANQPIEKGATYSGSALCYAGVIDSAADYKAQLELSDNSAPSGTWMALGSVGNISSHYSATMFLRIA